MPKPGRPQNRTAAAKQSQRHSGFQLGAIPPHLRRAGAKVDTELAAGTSGASPSRNSGERFKGQRRLLRASHRSVWHHLRRHQTQERQEDPLPVLDRGLFARGRALDFSLGAVRRIGCDGLCRRPRVAGAINPTFWLWSKVYRCCRRVTSFAQGSDNLARFRAILFW